MSVETTQKVDSTAEKVNNALLERISQITANYEGQLVSLKVQAEEIIAQYDARVKELEAELEKHAAPKGK